MASAALGVAAPLAETSAGMVAWVATGAVVGTALVVWVLVEVVEWGEVADLAVMEVEEVKARVKGLLVEGMVEEKVGPRAEAAKAQAGTGPEEEALAWAVEGSVAMVGEEVTARVMVAVSMVGED